MQKQKQKKQNKPGVKGKENEPLFSLASLSSQFPYLQDKNNTAT